MHGTQVHVYLYLQKNIYSAHSTISASSIPTRGIHNVIYLGKTLWMYYNSGICWPLIFQAGESVTCVDPNIVTVYILLFISIIAHVVHLEQVWYCMTPMVCNRMEVRSILSWGPYPISIKRSAIQTAYLITWLKWQSTWSRTRAYIWEVTCTILQRA